jgi:hypothetical protein
MFGASGIEDGSEFCGSPVRDPMAVASVTNSSGKAVEVRPLQIRIPEAMDLVITLNTLR